MEERKEKIAKLVEDYCSKKGTTPKKQGVIGLIDSLDQCNHSTAQIDAALKSLALKNRYLPDISQVLREINENNTVRRHPQEAPFEQLTHEGKVATAIVANYKKRDQILLTKRETQCLEYAKQEGYVLPERYA